MAQANGLTKRQRRGVYRQLGRDHQRRVSFDVLNLNGQFVANLDVPLSDGSITTDVTQQPIQSMTATFIDPGSKIGFDPDLSDFPTFQRRMLRVIDSRFIAQPEFTGWVDWTVFTGPIVDVDRDGAELTVTCHDKSELATQVAWKSRTFPKGAPRVNVVRIILDLAGESRFAIQKGNGRLSKKMELKKLDKLWQKANAAAPAGYVLFYTGNGVATLRRPPQRPVWTAPESAVLSTPRREREPKNRPNRYQVTGGKPTKKAKKKVVSEAYDLGKANPDNPLPGSGVGRNGTRRVYPKVESNPKIKSRKVVNNMARKARDNAAAAVVERSVDIVPVPFLEPYDVILVKTDDGSYRVKNSVSTYPLAGSSPMTIGARSAVAAPKGRRDSRGNK